MSMECLVVFDTQDMFIVDIDLDTNKDCKMWMSTIWKFSSKEYHSNSFYSVEQSLTKSLVKRKSCDLCNEHGHNSKTCKKRNENN
jgi:hypothetical protein